MAFQIFRHAFQIIFGNFGQALRVSIGPYLILIVAGFTAYWMSGLQDMSFPAVGQSSQSSETFLMPLFFASIFILICALFVFGWVAVAWHRFILLEEYVTTLPALKDRPIWAYVGRSVLYILLFALLLMPVLFVISTIFGPTLGSDFSNSSNLAFDALSMILTAVFTYLWFRVSLSLPAIAVGKPITMGAAWTASSGVSSTIFGVAFMLMAINGITGIFVSLVGGAVPLLGFALNVAVQWLTLMLGISILTTFYGHLIEKRPLIN